jgi:hypothetical protein
MRRAASTSRTCGRCAIGPQGRPLRGRPCGPIPDTDAYPGAPTDTQKKIKSTKNEVDRPRPFQG